ncbi:hypothetical protein CHARACLAT_008304 [Characodon lateralis]|uniref:Uncharacterized protein n=1 Tax=Characodon lateralis TaxID=208331 RepID=A0ABU7EHC6_9TELE|nr:hypothetical protein [Characodon lateralis]
MHKSGKLSVSYSCLDHEYFCPRRLNRTRNICLSDDLILISFFYFYAYFSAYFFSCDPVDTGSFCTLQPHYTDQHNAAVSIEIMVYASQAGFEETKISKAKPHNA